MVEKRYQVFVSSTFEDLQNVRSEVEKTLYLTGYIPVGMECFGARDETVLETVKKYLKGTDLAVFLIAGRYGSTNADGVSFTELEYNYIREQGIPVLIFIKCDIRNGRYIHMADSDQDQKTIQKLNDFKARLEGNHHVLQWSGINDLIKKLQRSLMGIKLPKGWVYLGEDIYISPNQTTVEYGMVNIKVKGEECENGTAKVDLKYLGSSLVDAPQRPVKYRDRVTALSDKILGQQFVPEAKILNEDNFNRYSNYLEYEITGPEDKPLFFTGSVVVNRILQKKQALIGLHIPYYTKQLVVNIDITEASFIQGYKGKARFINIDPNDVPEITQTFNKLSMTYTLNIKNIKSSDLIFAWKNDEV